MIDKALRFLTEEINQYLKSKLSFLGDKIILDNISRLNDASNNTNATNKVILSLVNIEEDRLYKNPENFTKTDDNKVVYKNPPVPVNVYFVFAFNHCENDTEFTNHYE